MNVRRTRTALLCAAGLVAAFLPAGTGTGTGAHAAAVASAPARECVSSPNQDAGQAARVRDIVRQAQRDLGLNAVVFRVTSGQREVVTGAVGESMTGVPADPAMHFRTGSVGIVYMATVLLQLVDEGEVGLDDPIARWLPDVPHADEITLRMLGNSTSGIHDYVTDPVFLKEIEAKPFRQWTPADTLAITSSHPLWYEPGTNWSYSHENFQLLGAALEKITGKPLDQVLQERVTTPLGLDQTANSATPEIPVPALHAFTSERGTYEESSYWNPSWTTAPGAVLTGDVCDLATSARAIGTGELLSKAAFRTQLNPGTVGLGTPTKECPAPYCRKNTEALHFGFGILVLHDWTATNPSFSGYAAVSAYLPAQDLSLAVSVTKGPTSPEGNSASTIAERIAKALAPDHPLVLE
ncbi:MULTISPECIES: serine hydrolase [unclassified Streptomyces]|uniref:serine hydrolase domain-containing protein n=1 Tax=unclassified Streptomyces TaxID=2593676 RepID=UPI00224D8E3D|nr:MULTISPECIES: serine hydrolase domain-containing protein [unclassified Streptomyces]MCX4524752.1 beta-lactamase family protein [Streptomyces sp. NBC_01551]MCX4544738.1 beta-lactamase family protein [Streptomyces sp. NBC_01565]